MISSLGFDLSLLSGGEDHGVLAQLHFHLAGNGFGALGAWIDVVTCTILPVFEGVYCATTKYAIWSEEYVELVRGKVEIVENIKFLLDCFFVGEVKTSVSCIHWLGSQCLPPCFNAPMQSRPFQGELHVGPLSQIARDVRNI